MSHPILSTTRRGFLGALGLGAAADAGLTGRPAGPVIRACMRSAQCPLVIITAPVGARPPVVGTPVAVS